MKKLLLPFIALLFFYSESIFVSLAHGETLLQNRIIVPHFLLMYLLFLAVYYQHRTALLLGFIFGFLYDMYYTEINGIYLVLFPFLILLTVRLMKIFYNNLFVFGVIVIINMAIIEFLVYQINIIIQRTELSLIQFMDWRLWPTLVLNIAFYIIVSFPLKALFVKLQKAWLEE